MASSGLSIPLSAMALHQHLFARGLHSDRIWQVGNVKLQHPSQIERHAILSSSSHPNCADQNRWKVCDTNGVRTRKQRSIKAKVAESTSASKPSSIVCPQCDGNGVVSCSQCKGSGINSVDHFNGRFKAGTSCWLCRGKREMLCGNCNGAGFVGGFLSTLDD
eukprot:c15077_g1_i1 orf=95-580(-)